MPPYCWLDPPSLITRLSMISHLALTINSSANFLVYVALGTKFKKAFWRTKDSFVRQTTSVLIRSERQVFFRLKSLGLNQETTRNRLFWFGSWFTVFRIIANWLGTLFQYFSFFLANVQNRMQQEL